MSKNVTLYNKSEKNFVISKDITICAKRHAEVPADIAKKLLAKYKKDLTDVKIDSGSDSKLEAKIKAFEQSVADFEKEKEAFAKEKADFEKAAKTKTN